MYTRKQLNEVLNQSKFIDWFKSVRIIFDFSFIDNETRFEKVGFFDIYAYVKRQAKAWNKLKGNLPGEFSRSKELFDSLIYHLDVIVQESENENEPDPSNKWNHRIQEGIAQIMRNKNFPADHPKTIFLYSLYQESSNYYLGAYNYWFNVSNQLNFSNPTFFKGALFAYEFDLQKDNPIAKRARYEKSSITALRNDFEGFFTKCQQEINEFHKRSTDLANQYNEEVNSFISTNNSEYENWFKSIKENEEQYSKHCLTRAQELEKLYGEKLMLEKPADYWDKRATKLRTESRQWLIWLMVSIFISVIIMVIILGMISNGTIEKVFSTTGTAIKWSIVFLTIVSLLAYAVKTFTKLCLSSLHLSRDAEERKQLAYVYLALRNDKVLKDDERHLVFQAIFSRADTGLFKEDSSPTMPGMLERMINRG